MRTSLLALTAAALFTSTTTAQGFDRSYPPKLPGARAEVYKTVGDVTLKLYIVEPEDHKASDKRPAIVFFFGGGWSSGTPAQFYPHAKYLASRGMTAMLADYRVASRHGVKAKECVADAKSAVRWIRQNAERLGVDPDRIVAAGGSAGGHLAACTGVVPGFDDEGEASNVSSVPNALALFNPAVVLADIEGLAPRTATRVAALTKRMGVEPAKLSPAHHVKPGAPPTIVFHGKADTTVPYQTVEIFAAAMKKVGNQCELHGYEDQGHGFFNQGRGDGTAYTDTVRALDQFLAKLGYLEGEPAIQPAK